MPRPNILFIMADQLSALATSPYGNDDVLTPHLQRLADGGLVFERTYCNHPLCAPSRASMMAGQFPGRLPVNDNSEELPASVPTFVHYLRRAGYKTILSGKMHYVGPDQLHGYDEETHYRALEALRGLAQRRGPDRDQPWFLCVSYTHPHDPYVNLPEYWDRYAGREIAMPEAPPPGWQPHPMDVWTNTYHGVDVVDPTPEDVYRSRRGYYASTSYFDDKLGQLLSELERLGMAGNTLVVVTADHGDMCGERGMWFKRTVREWSARVPLIAAGAGTPPGARVSQNVSLVDLFPT